MAKERLHIFWSGRVQGVGFRFTAEGIALEHKLSGWVRNLNDGRVEAVAEGSKEQLEAFVEAVATGAMQAHIQNTDITWETATGEFADFVIRYF